MVDFEYGAPKTRYLFLVLVVLPLEKFLRAPMTVTIIFYSPETQLMCISYTVNATMTRFRPASLPHTISNPAKRDDVHLRRETDVTSRMPCTFDRTYLDDSSCWENRNFQRRPIARLQKAIRSCIL